LKGSRLPNVDIGTQADSIGERILSSDSESHGKIRSDVRVAEENETMRVIVQQCSRNNHGSDWSQHDTKQISISGEMYSPDAKR
jgi:hypothetical protein